MKNVISDDWACEKAEIYISTAREQNGLGTIDVKHDWYRAVYKVLVRPVVAHSRPASVGALTFVFFFMYRYCFVTRDPFNPGGFMALHWFGEYVSSFCFPQGFFGFSYPAVSQVIA